MNTRNLKSRLPRWVRAPLGRCRSYLVRLSIWFRVAREVRGKAPRDQHVLYRAILKAPFTAMQSLQLWQDPRVSQDCCVVVKDIGEFHVRADTDDLWHVLPSREPAVLSTIRDRLHEGGVFVDAGANIGFYSVLASRLVGLAGRVISIEMMPQTADILREHLIINRCENVTVIENALSTSSGLTLEAKVEQGKSGQASIVHNISVHASKSVQVETITLDDLLRKYSCINLVKMDLEGAELDALAGAHNVLGRVEAVIFEDRRGDPRVREFLFGLGFDLQPLGKADVLGVRR